MLNFTKLPLPVLKTAYSLRKGDVIETSTALFAFDRFPKGGKSWYGKSMTDGRSFRIHLLPFGTLKVVGNYEFEEVVETIISVKNDFVDLQPGDLFVIKHGRGENAELFRFVRHTDRKVVAINPVTNKTFNIDKSFTFTKIGSLPY